MKIFQNIVKLVFISFSLLSVSFGQNINKKKLIEFGWDYPNISFLKSNISLMERTPFDGVIFSFDFNIYNAFDTIQYPDSKFQWKDLSEIQWKKFTDNFLLIRGAGVTGAHWMDDHSWVNIVNNLKKISRAITVSSVKGIGFDPEYYFKDSTLNPWVYRASWYNNLTYQEVGKFVRKRGRQFIKALQTCKPDIKILCFWLLGLVSLQNQKNELSKTGMALYPFFVEGMLQGQNKYSEIIDGNEASYGFYNPVTFVESGIKERKDGSKLVATPLQKKFNKISIAQAVYFDLIYGKTARLDKGYSLRLKEQWLYNNLYDAFKSTDKYVWFYNERINWWKHALDSGVAEIIRNVKYQVRTEFETKANILKGSSFLSSANRSLENTSKQRNNKDFNFIYKPAKKELQIQFLKSNTRVLQVFENSRLIYAINNPPEYLPINLKGKYNRGNLIIVSKDSGNNVFIAYVN